MCGRARLNGRQGRRDAPQYEYKTLLETYNFLKFASFEHRPTVRSPHMAGASLGATLARRDRSSCMANPLVPDLATWCHFLSCGQVYVTPRGGLYGT
eukprot:758293-Hanusia_phi.AAC.1